MHSARPAPILLAHYGENWIRGSERTLLDLLTHVDRDRFLPILWCNGEMVADEARKLDVTVYHSRFSVLYDWEPPRYDVARFVSLVREGRKIVRAHGIRVLHANSAAPNQWLVPVSRSLRVPLLCHLLAPYSARERFTLGVHLATLIAGVTRGCTDDLLADGLPESSVSTIHCGVDLGAWRGWDQSGLRSQLGIRPQDIVITQVGSLIHRKGHDILLRAVADLRQVRPNIRVILVGDGPDRQEIENVVRELGLVDIVHILGFVDSPAGVIFRDATDIAVSPSRVEGFGLTVIEAGAAGLPVVATATTGMSEIITNERTGLIVPIEDQDRLYAALLRLVDDASLRKQLGTALRSVVNEKFVIGSYVTGFESAYEQLMRIPSHQLGWSRDVSGDTLAMYARWVGGTLSRRLRRSVG
jgi:glycosyltransferase involved in cell wall biosynthesis